MALCSFCNAKPVLARGLCAACYYRERRSGSVERRNVQNLGKLCSAPGCDKPAHAKGMCLHHYMQADHPLKAVWKLLRNRNRGDHPISWDRFDSFLAEVGERPSPKHQLRRIDQDKPWSASNAHWLAPIAPGRDAYSPEQRQAYGRAHNLRRRFGLSSEDYDRMLNEQGGVCAICRKVETHRYPSGKLKDLSVDHDHTTGRVRGLLCVSCNRALGYLNDDPELLEKAAAYIRRHALKVA